MADSASSTNWAGYAVHRPGVLFRTVHASWREPNAVCSPGQQGYSAYWVGLGGYSQSSKSLEQVGTEVDCRPSGGVKSYAWYENVPSRSFNIPLTVRPGDLVQARVTVKGHLVSILLVDATRHRRFTKTVRARTIDVSSAEWIVEAPSACTSSNSCRTLPLADFGSAAFSSAGVVSARARRGPIADRHWTATSITLNPTGREFVGFHGFGPSGGAATPSALSAAGNSFNVTYSPLTVLSTRHSARMSSVLAPGQITH